MKPGKKPDYAVPSMTAVARLKWNGLKVASTFSGAGGSCLGYRMAGFRVVWANEFVPAAQETYKANAAADSLLDCRDVREVTAESILEATGLRKGQLDLLDGSPPCQAFSTAGRRERGWGQEKKYEHGAHQKNEDLFYQYVRLLGGLMPRTFVAENVSGLVKGVAKGYFLDILAKLKACGYRVECRVLDAQWLGVPQQRSRVIFIGVRDDLGFAPPFPRPLGYRYSVAEACGWRPGAAMTVGDPKIPQRAGNSFPRGERRSLDLPSPVIHASANAIGGAPTHEILIPGQGVQIRQQQGAFNKRVSPGRPSPTILATQDNQFVIEPEPPTTRRDKLRAVAGSYDNFKNKKDVTNKPCPALLTAQPNHYLVENDGSDATRRDDKGAVRRRFTIAELKRICSFPDDFVLTGSYSQQWERLGNSVPPVMMLHIASAIRDALLAK